MTRIGVIICFALTLLCPVVCLAGTSDECSTHDSQSSENCEAMASGAVVNEPHFGIASPHQFQPNSDGVLPHGIAALRAESRLLVTAKQAEHAKSSPIAARRQAILQIFLF